LSVKRELMLGASGEFQSVHAIPDRQQWVLVTTRRDRRTSQSLWQIYGRLGCHGRHRGETIEATDWLAPPDAL